MTKSWDRQEGETLNQYCWFNEFLQHNDFSLKRFHEKIVNNNSIKSKQKNNKSKKIPTLNTVNKWSSCNNWTKRKTDYIKYKTEQQRHRLEEADYKENEEIYLLKKRLIKKGLERALEELESEKPSGYHYSNYVNGATKLLDDNRIDTGRATSISEVNADVTSEVNVETSSVFDKLKEFEKELDEL